VRPETPLRLADRLRARLPRVAGPTAFIAAVACVLIGALVRVPLDHWAGAPLPPYITFSPAIVIAGILGGIRAGLLACALSIAMAWFLWIAPYQSWQVTTTRDVLTIVVYMATGSLMAYVSGSARLLLERVQASELQRIQAAKETVHRIKNLIAVVHALSRQASARATSLEEYRNHFEARLLALGRAQDTLVASSWEAVELNTLIDAALAPFRDHAALSVRPGPSTIIPGPLVSGLSMALYELGTNALKYGALALADGQVSVSWTCSETRCVLIWRERGALGEKERSSGGGLGSGLIRAALAGLPDTRVEYEMHTDGVKAQFDWPTS
jgi:two-component sensor histidine kinase